MLTGTMARLAHTLTVHDATQRVHLVRPLAVGELGDATSLTGKQRFAVCPPRRVLELKDASTGFLLTAAYFFYLGWWLEHEEDLGYGPTHTHAGATSYHIGAMVFGALWAITGSVRWLPHIHLAAAVFPIGAIVILCLTRLPYNPDGIDPRITASVAVLLLACVPCCRARTAQSYPRLAYMAVVVNATYFFYLAWWLAHEDGLHEDHDMHRQNRTVWRKHLSRIHPEAQYYWLVAIPFSLIWLVSVLHVYYPTYLYEKPFVFVLLAGNAVLLCSISLPYNSDGIDRFAVLAVTITTVVLVCLVHPTALVRIRMRRWCVASPSTIEAIMDHAERRDTPVANAWSYWLRYEGVDGTAFVLGPGTWSGIRVDGDTATVRSGTTFRQLDEHLRLHGKTIEDRCQFDDVTIGGALVTRSHGCNAQKTFINCILQLEAIRAGTRTVVVLRAPPTILADWVVVSVTLRLVKDVCVKVHTRNICAPSEYPLRAWDGADFRTLWVNASLCLWMTGVYASTGKPCASENDAHVANRKKCYNLGFFLGIACTRKSTLPVSEVHCAVRAVYPVEMAFIKLLDYRNTSVTTTEVVRLTEVVPRLVDFHRRVGGRTVVRRCKETTMIDVAVRSAERVCEFLALLRSMGVRDITLHSGKWTPSADARNSGLYDCEKLSEQRWLQPFTVSSSAHVVEGGKTAVFASLASCLK